MLTTMYLRACPFDNGAVTMLQLRHRRLKIILPLKMTPSLSNFPTECPKTHIFYPNIAKIFFEQLDLEEFINVRHLSRKKKPTPEVILGEKSEKKDDDLKDRGFTAKAWKALPRHMEGAEIEYLAKRRKGLITVTSKAATIPPTLTKTTVKRIDAAGNEYVQDVVVSHGQQVEGQVISQNGIPDPNTGVLLQPLKSR